MNEDVGIRMRSVWGDVFEVAVKRGILAYLVENGHLEAGSPLVPAAWQDTKVRQISQHCIYQAAAVSDHAIKEVRSYCDHLLSIGHGIGWTTMRRYWESVSARGSLQVGALWCPFDLKDRSAPLDFDGVRIQEEFRSAFGLADTGNIAGKGWPARSDFMMQLRGRSLVRLLCMEFSLNVPTAQSNYADPAQHREEMSRYVSLVESRGVFSNIAAEVEDSGGRFNIAPQIVSHMQAFTSSDKPLYKLMQGCSYASTAARILPQTRRLDVDVIAVTAAGIERVSAPFGAGSEDNVRRAMMESMGKVYRDTMIVPSSGPEDFASHLETVYRHIRRGMPRAFKTEFERFLSQTETGKVQTASIIERMEDFMNPETPADEGTVAAWLSQIRRDERLDSFLGPDPEAAIRNEVSRGFTLRNLNAAAIRAVVKRTMPGEMKTVGLLGHPGIGKTTSVINIFAESQDCGVLFAYFSPRVVINGDVTDKIAKTCGSGSFAVTTNSHLIGVASEWARAQGISRDVTAAVTVEAGLAVNTRPHGEGGVLHLLKHDAQDATEGNYVRKDRKRDLDVRTMEMTRAMTRRVLKTLATEVGWLMNANPTAPVVTVTAAIQGFRMAGSSSTTVDDLRAMFRHKADTAAGLEERRKLAEVRPLIVVMIDEITGDAAGAPMVHAVAEWLRSEFMNPFPEGESPFRVVLILADASLATPATLSSYMASTRKTPGVGSLYADAPARVMVSPVDRTVPFGVETGRISIGEANEDILYVMADAYPAASLEVEYRIRLDQVDMKDAKDTEGRKREREAHGERMLRAAANAITAAVEREPERQVIYFAQNKRFLDEVRNLLIAEGMSPDKVATLHSSIDAEKRRLLVSDAVRDGKSVFLMTSAGSRGVSFPKATSLIIQVPRFEVESSLMEIGQMIFRGRGKFLEDGVERNGDILDRRIVFMIEDYVRTDERGALEPVQWASRKMDLASLVILLRSTVETRIRGRSTSPGFEGAVIPVGRIGLDLTTDSISGSLSLLVEECRVAGASKDSEIVGTARTIENLVGELYGNFSLVGKKAGMKSFTDASFAESFSLDVCRPTSKLIGQRGTNASVPASAHFCGPCIYESWGDVKNVGETFSHGVDSTDKRRKLNFICEILSQNMDAPKRLRDAAYRIAEITSRVNPDLENSEFSVRKNMESKGLWVAIPADWTRFVSDRDGSRDVRSTKLSAPDLWLGTMRQAISLHRTPTEVFPIVPNFDDMPFAAAQTFGDPTGMDLAFDGRYFFSSTEFNLLNVILHGWRDEG